MLEREVPSETVKVKGTPIYNGLFGVHKGWIDEGNGNWRRSLRLIVNLIPTNLLQRRMPDQASKSMGYAPLWGNMVLLEDEVVLSYGEDVKHCFHIFSPGPRWRGYFVLSKEASGGSFNDGVKEKGSRASRGLFFIAGIGIFPWVSEKNQWDPQHRHHCFNTPPQFRKPPCLPLLREHVPCEGRTDCVILGQ